MRITCLTIAGLCLLTTGAAQKQSRIDSLSALLTELESRRKLIQEQIDEVKVEIAALSAGKTKSADCETVVSNETDKVSGVNIVSAPAKPIVVSSPDGLHVATLSWLLSSGAKKLTLMIKVDGGSLCIDAGAKVNMVFRDGARQAFPHGSGLNCEGNANLEFNKTSGTNHLDLLSQREISRIRIRTSKSVVELNLPPSQATSLMKSTECIRGLLIE